MGFIIQSFKKKMIFSAMAILSLVVFFSSTNHVFAAYYQILNDSYRIQSYTPTFTYYSGGLGVKVWCRNTSGDSQIMELQRFLNQKYYPGVEKTVYCGEGYYKYNYFYYPNAVSGGRYSLYFWNTGYNGGTTVASLTDITVQVNPN